MSKILLEDTELIERMAENYGISLAKKEPCNCIAENIANGIEKYNWSKDFVLNGAGKHLADSDKIPLIGFAKPSQLPTNFVKSTHCPFCGTKYEDSQTSNTTHP